ncbi:hypothetical protein K435DRAFT_865279 [Dendrothele bispora CBS 962.96]|uniref:BAG domain-containing protein n=1 Tax=Dendrothele bispora (strain CBS 962.96) TaxID=1314807 RepID=A0A4S8LJV6_DENBC|nr:hypothetical protein K435DRAFT_865279 [Dendrothele bispora CBS 962.96]
MFSTLRPQYPSLSSDLYSRPSSNPRDRYLAALAEARAAEADYLAAEAVQREEEALRRRLEEIQFQKRHNRLSQYTQSVDSYSYGHPSRDRLALLRQEIQEEELRQAVIARERELDALRRQELEEAELIAFKKRQEEQKLELLTRRRQEEEKRLLALRQGQQAEKTRRLARVLESPEAHPVVRLLVNPQNNTCSQPHRRVSQSQPAATHPCRRLSNTHSSCTPASVFVQPNTESRQFEDALKLLFGQAVQSTPTKPGKPKNPETRQTDAFRKPTVRFSLPEPEAQPQEEKQPAMTMFPFALPTAKPVAVPTPIRSLKEQLENRLNNDEAVEIRDTIQAIFASLVDAAGQTAVASGNAESSKPSASTSSTSVPSTSSSTSTSSAAQPPRVPSPTSFLKDQLEARMNSDEAIEIRDTVQAILASLVDTTGPTAASGKAESSKPSTSTSTSVPCTSSSSSASFAAQPPRAPSPTSFLKDQLEARMNSDEAIEIRDTIQAIFASLADNAGYTNSGGANTSSTAASTKGKERSAPIPTDVAAEPTSADVLKSMETVRNIEASFLSLQSDFVFPSQLDFTPTSSRSPSPSRHENINEPSTPTSDSSILKLAYTSRNHPVRYYEQTLSALLTQLDGVQSYGNEDVRGRRKEVVARVEKALEDLEGEIEGRWKSKVAKETREVDVPTVQESSISEPMVGAVEAAPVTAEVNSSQPEISERQASAEISQESVSDATGSVETDSGSKQDDQEQYVSSLAALETEEQVQEDAQSQSLNSESTIDLTETSMSSPSSISVTETEQVTKDSGAEGQQDVEPALDQSTASSTSTYPPSVNSYPPSYPATTLSTTPSLSASSSVATIRPYDVDPEPQANNTSRSELEPGSGSIVAPVSLSMSMELPAAFEIKSTSPEQGSEEDSDDSGVDAFSLPDSEIEGKTESTRGVGKQGHDSDGDWSEVEA